MSKKAMRKNLLVSIKKSMGRYIAILAIIALGAGLFVGLLASKNDIVATGQAFTDEQNMFDFRLLNTYGWTQDEVDALVNMEGIRDVEGLAVLDVVGYLGIEDSDEAGYLGTRDMDNVFQLHQIPENVNRVLLLGGRMPEKPNECLVDGYYATEEILGATFSVTDNNDEDTLDSLKYHTFTVVGYVSTPLFMDMTRGNTTLGNGSITSYVYLPKEAFDLEYYTEIDITIEDDHKSYTSEYDDAIEQAKSKLEPKITLLADNRYESIYSEAMEKYNEGLQEYQDGLEELEEAKLDADKELGEAYQELIDAEKEIADGEKELKSAQKKIDQGKAEIKKNKETLRESQKELDEAKEAAFAELDAAEQDLMSQKSEAESGLNAVNTVLAEIEKNLPELTAGIEKMESALQQLQAQINELNSQILQMQDQEDGLREQIEEIKKTGSYEQAILDELEANRSVLLQQIEELKAVKNTAAGEEMLLRDSLISTQQTKAQLLSQQAECVAARDVLSEGLKQLEVGLTLLTQKRITAQKEFAELQASLDAGLSELNAAQKTLSAAQKELDKGRKELEDGKNDLQEGWDSYYEGKEEAETEIADAEQTLADAEIELRDAKKEIDDLEKAELYMLNRSTNVGYLAVENNSNIVSGVSRVFPAFFLLVASLVCITTMTRMVEEERTQIGTLKALGYSNGAIISKYLLYAGSAAVVGCGLGVFVGSMVFPLIIWEGYKIILEMQPQLEIVFDIPLCIAVVLVYTAVILAVTWYCCRMSLRETPAELIRPKAPTAGKKIFLEHLPFWDKIGFLNKVMFRNIFRYKQRLLMMLVGIGGCTALLVTGFGMGDSIMDIVSYQYEEVTLYDIQVQYSDSLSAERIDAIQMEMADSVDGMNFVHQSSVDISHNGMTKSLYMICGEDTLSEYFDLHAGTTPIAMPEHGQALLSIGMAQMMGIEEGDVITVRNSDMEEMQVTVASIFDNNVYNYLIVSADTVSDSWGERPEIQNAFVKVPDSEDAHEVSAKLSAMDDVLSVMVCQDMADQVNSMLQGLDLIIGTIIVCAGLLAVIVLYNLTNINIKERIREISTIKVLGFRAGETAAYVFKENMLLTAMGAVLGLGLGKLLLAFVMDQIRIDIVWMQARVTGQSLLWSVLITMLMAILVDFFLYFRLEKINMAESLKSVE